MREIKYRQILSTGEFHYWGFVNGGFIAPDAFDGSLETCQKNSEQFTGLKDKDSVEIYEGDIVKYFDSYRVWLTSYVRFNGGCFDVPTDENPLELCLWASHYETDYQYDGSSIKELEVIGNIHQNPELLND